MDNESSEASTPPPTVITVDNTVPDGIESYLEDLIKGLLIDSGGIVNVRDLGRKLAACNGIHDASKSALQELKENFGSLKRFVTAHTDLFNTKTIQNGKNFMKQISLYGMFFLIIQI